MARVLYLKWNSFAGEYLETALCVANIETVEFPFDFTKEGDRKDTRMDAALTESIVRTLMSGSFDALFSFNYFPVAAIAAKACHIRYISWVYDSPYIQLYSQTINFSTNDIRLFDKAEVYRLRRMGINTVSYLPLAAAPDILRTVINCATEEKVRRFTSDISFVGAMYTEPRQQLYARLLSVDENGNYRLPKKDIVFLQELIEKQKNVYGMNFIEESLSEDIIERMNKVAPVYLHGDGFETREWVYANYYLYRQVTALERTEIMNLLSRRGYDLKIYTHPQTEVTNEVVKSCEPKASDNDFFPININKSETSMISKQVSILKNEKIRNPHLTKGALSKNCGTVDYYKEAPIVFANSKINLNITLRSIGSGIPLRAFEIMGSGGFLLTNYQEDFLELFEPGKDFVYYEDYDDMISKIDYYLAHDEERETIARSGYEKVCKYHTFENRVRDLIY